MLLLNSIERRRSSLSKKKGRSRVEQEDSSNILLKRCVEETMTLLQMIRSSGKMRMDIEEQFQVLEGRRL